MLQTNIMFEKFYLKLLEEMVDVLKEAHNRGDITSRDGNVSVSTWHPLFGPILIATPSGVVKNRIDPMDCLVMQWLRGFHGALTAPSQRVLRASALFDALDPLSFNLNDSLVVATPTGEIIMHTLVQAARQNDIQRAYSLRTIDPKILEKITTSSLHLHPTWPVAAMQAGWDLRDIADELPELGRYTRVGPNVPRLAPTTEVLAEETFKAFAGLGSGIHRSYHWEALPKFDVIGLAAHGTTAIGTTPWDAYYHTERLSHACEITLRSGNKPPEKNRIA